MKKIIPALLLVLVCSQSCKKDLQSQDPQLASSAVAKEHLKISIVSDIHYMDPSLITNGGAAGTAFQEYLDKDPKLLEYSDPVFRKVVDDLQREKPDILLVPGDITKDGERVSHEAMANFFHQLEAKGTRVFVVPGNHDINNAKAARFDGNNAYPVPTVQASEFSAIYHDFGFGEAFDRDPNSLSYAVELYPDLWLIAIDASRYEEYTNGDIPDGRIKPATMNWILSKMEQAGQQNIKVFGMMHQNLIEHYTGQSQLDPGYVIEDWQQRTDALLEAGLQIIFTGHYHANDISAYTKAGKTLYDIQTGSLVTAPMQYRMITVKNKTLDIDNIHVKSINADLPAGYDFATYSRLFLAQHLDGYLHQLLTSPAFSAPEEVADFATPIFRTAVMAHFAGDEKMPPDQRKLIVQLASISEDLAAPVYSLWTDTGVKDSKTTIKLE